jgi:hypothetical protein
MSGKTTLARKMAALYTSLGRNVIVLDELMDEKWVSEGGAQVMTDDPEQFKEVFWNSRNLAVFIDEAGESVGRYDKSMSMTATRGRHWGHICHYICQRGAMLSPSVRGQCSEVYAFQCTEKDAEALAEAFVQPKLREASGLAQGEYIRAVRFGADRKPYFELGSVF